MSKSSFCIGDVHNPVIRRALIVLATPVAYVVIAGSIIVLPLISFLRFGICHGLAAFLEEVSNLLGFAFETLPPVIHKTWKGGH